MKINQIRPDHLQSLAREAYLKDVHFYLQNKNKFKTRACPACLLPSSGTYIEKDGFNFGKCISCGSVFMNPGPSLQLIDEFYKNSHNYKFWGEYMYPQSRLERLKTIHISRADWVINTLKKQFPNQQKFEILELGAGTGDTLSTITKNKSIEITGFAIEPNASMRSSLDSNNVTLINNSDLNLVEYKSKFDAVISFEVLEHLLNPGEYLFSISQNLKKAGLFLATTPNASSLEVQFLQDSSSTIDIEHISVLTPSGVQALALRNGFKVNEVCTPGELDLELIRKKFPGFTIYFSEKTKDQDIQMLIKSIGFSSHMRLILSLA